MPTSKSNNSIKIYSLKIFGTTKDNGSVVLIVENDNYNYDERLEFTLKQNKSACIFMREDVMTNNLILDFYCPHARSPLCLHGTMAAGYVYFQRHREFSQVTVCTHMSKQRMKIEKRGEQIFVSIEPQGISSRMVEIELIEAMLNINSSQVVSQPCIASVGSPKLLIEVNSLDTLYSIKPNLELIYSWGKGNQINGCYVYYKLSNGNFYGRNFNHLDPRLEDSATGVAAGALTLVLQRDIIVYQGELTNNPCIIYTKFQKGNILVGGNVTPA